MKEELILAMKGGSFGCQCRGMAVAFHERDVETTP